MSGRAAPLRDGVISALVTPFDASGAVDGTALDALVDFQIERGVDGLFVLGTSGEGLLLSPRERSATASRVLARAAGRVPVAVHCGAADTATAIGLVSDAAAAGVRTVAAISPLFFDYGEEGIFAHFRAMAETAPDLDHYIYDNPARVGCAIGVEAVCRLAAQFECVRGVKDTGDSLGRIATYLAVSKDLRVFTGNNMLVLGALATGAAGAVSTTANAVPELFAALLAAFRSGDLDRARELQHVATRLQRVLAGLPYVAAAKHLLELRGLPGGSPRSPLPGLSDEQRAALDRRLDGDGALARWLVPV